MADPTEWGAIAVADEAPKGDPSEWGAVAVPSNVDRAKLNARVGFSQSGLGLLARTPLGNYKDMPVGTFGPTGDAVPWLWRMFDAPTNKEETQALRQQYEAMPGAQGFAERASSVAGYIGGSWPSPENSIPVGRAGSLAVRTAKAAGAAAATNAAFDVAQQALDINQGLQDEFSFKQLMIDAGAGAVVGGVVHLSFEGLDKLEALARERLKAPGVKPAEVDDLKKVIDAVDAETAKRQGTGDGGQETGDKGQAKPAAKVPEVTLNSRDRRTLRRQAAREAGDAGEQAVAQRYDELAAAELENRRARAAANVGMDAIDEHLATQELGNLQETMQRNQIDGPDIASVAKEMSDETAKRIALKDQLQQLDRIKAATPLPEVTAEMSPQARRMTDQYGFIAPKVAGSIAGGGVGAAYGLTQGDTPQERIENALLYGGIGAASPWVLGGIARRGKKPGKLPADLAEIDAIFKAPEKPSKLAAAKALPRDAYRALVSEYSGLARAEAVLRKAANMPRAALSMARKFELLHGAAGKAEADLIRFDRAVAEPIKGMEREFNIYAFLKRTASRLDQQNVNAEAAKRAEMEAERAWNAARDTLKEKPGFLNAKREMKAREALKAARAETERAASSRKVGNYTLADVTKRLDSLRTHVGEDRWALFEATAQTYQRHMDDVLKLAQLSGRLSEDEVAAIRKTNDFYAPFRVLKHVDEADMAGRTLNRGELFQRIKGVSQEDLQLEDILVASRENIYRSRIMAEKNLKMQELAGLAALDKEGQFVKVLGEGAEPRKGYDTAKVFMDGREITLEVNHEIAAAVKGLNATQTGLVGKFASLAASPFRLGATGANLSFQAVNLLFADLPRFTLISKYGLGPGRTLTEKVSNALRLPLDYALAMNSSIRGNFGKPDALYMQWLESGGARSTIQDHIRGLGDAARAGIAPGGRIRQVRGVIDGVGAIANSIEETTKLVGLKRGLRAEGYHAGLTPKQQAAIMDRVASEVRNYAGSPDFGRRGTHTRNANLLFMFFNARIQGVEADARRLFGADGKKVAAATWAKIGAAVGTPTVALWFVNQTQENARDYAQVPDRDKENYWHIPRYDAEGRPLYFTNDEGAKVRDYWRIPKRETVKLFANMTESFLDFNRDKDPQHLGQFGISFLENVSPVNISGRNFEERLESVISSTNPLVKAPIQLALGRNTFYHRDTIPQRLQGGFGGVSPELQFTESTPELFKRAAVAMPDFLPERLRSPLYLQQLTQDMSAGLVTQFATGKTPEGREDWQNLPGVKRFLRSPYVENEAVLDMVRKEDRAETDERLIRMREARDLVDAIKELPDRRQKAGAFVAAVQKDPKIVEALKDTAQADARGLTSQDRIVLGLGVESGARARFYHDLVAQMAPAEKRTFLIDQMKKKLITPDVAKQMAVLELQARKKGKR